MSLTLSDNHLLFNTNSEVIDLCQPLFENSFIDYFDYEYYNFEDGSHYGLISHPNIAKAYFKESLYLTEGEFNIIKQYNLRLSVLSTALILPQVPTSLRKLSKNVEMCANQNISHRVYLLRHQEKSIEIYGFGTSIKDGSALDKILGNIDVIERFVDHFKTAGESLIKRAQKSIIMLPDFFNASGNLQVNDIAPFAREKIIEGLLDKNQTALRLAFKALTKQEKNIIEKISQGISYKEAANQLAISPRTVEVHIQNIKSKLNLHRKSDLQKLSDLILP